jgi:hypothetical protein
MAANSEAVSFYFFDFDDNIMFLATPIFILNTMTSEAMEVSTGEFADIYPRLGSPGEWENFSMYDGSYLHFRDIPADRLRPGQKQYFVADVEQAVEGDPEKWQGPSWRLFVHACETQRPVSIVTARGHSPDTIKAGVGVLVDKGIISQEPNYHTVFPVGNDELRREQLDDPMLTLTTPILKRRAIVKSVEKALEVYGDRPEHRFGMSDDDPQNVNLIIRAMCDCKKRHLDKRFFVINTHQGEMVKMEIFPVDFSVTEQIV